jgi:AcrR family transcriptional regulator
MVTRAAQAEKTRQTVLDTARKLFVEHGFDATSLQQIADAMGVTKANVYYYFRTKIAILEALLAPTVAALTARLDDAERITDQEERVDHLITTWVDQVVVAYRTIAPMSRHDPIVRRHEKIARELDELAQRGLDLMFGPAPTVDEQAAYWLISDLGVVNRRLDHLGDDELRATLVRLCRGVVREAGRARSTNTR